jgi:V/A-type H+-transporting ATPase subunit C
VARLDYLNAWLGGRRTRLLGASGLRALLACASTEARCELLRRELPRAGLPAELVPDPLARAEAALREDWRREAAAVVEGAEGRRPRALLAAFLALDEAVAVKVILRGVSQGLPPDRTVAAAPPAPGLPETTLRAAAAAGRVEDAVDSLLAAGCALAGPVRDALPLREGGGLLPLELAADRAAFARARRACRGRSEDAALLRAHLDDRTDARNAATLLALAGAAPVEDPFVARGRRLTAAAFGGLLGAPAAAVRAAVAGLFGLPERDLALPWSADRALERVVGAWLRREARRRPLSLAVPLSYLADRLAEVHRIAVVMRGAALGLEGAEILDLAEA